MTLALVLVLALSQTGQPPDAVPVVPVVPEGGETTPPVPAEQKESKPPMSVFTRSAIATSSATLAGGASLGIALLLVGNNPNFDATFATAALASLLITGVAFALHEVLGGRGEITLSFLLTAVVMAGAGALGAALAGGDRILAPVLAAAIGSLPAAAAAVFGLEVTSPKPKTQVAVRFGPTGIYGQF